MAKENSANKDSFYVKGEVVQVTEALTKLYRKKIPARIIDAPMGQARAILSPEKLKYLFSNGKLSRKEYDLLTSEFEKSHSFMDNINLYRAICPPPTKLKNVLNSVLKDLLHIHEKPDVHIMDYKGKSGVVQIIINNFSCPITPQSVSKVGLELVLA